MISTEERKASIVMLLASFRPSPMGGAELQAFKLAKELLKRGFQIRVITLAQKGQLKAEDIDGVEILRVPLFLSPYYYKSSSKKRGSHTTQIEFKKNEPKHFGLTNKKPLLALANYFIFFWNVQRLLRNRKYDLIYVPMVEWLAFVAAMVGKKQGKKVVIKDSTMNGMTNLLRYPLGSHMRRVIVGHCYFVAMTKIIKANLTVAGIKEENIFSIPNGVEIHGPRRQSFKRNKFTFVGNLHQQPAKGVDILLKAWKMVVAEIPEAELFIIGDGDLPAYSRYVIELGISDKVHFLGKQTSVDEHLLESAAFILPSRREGMSNALLEAMALGVPCIATNISGNCDLIDNNVNGLLVPVEDEHSLAVAVNFIFNNPETAEKMGLEARKTILAEYDFKMVSDKYFRLFIDLIKTRP
jgi:glycosyltransferase involved in cell wall biosynthesis